GVNDGGILGVHEDGRNGSGFVDPDIGPGGAGVGGFPEAVAGKLFAGSDVDGFGIRGSDDKIGNGSDAGVVENGKPGDAAVGGFPDPGAGGANVVGFGIAGDAGDGGYTPAAKGANQAPGEAFHGVEGKILGGR